MEGKRVLVTGAGTGIGSGIAEAFAREGARVAAHFSHSRAGADELVARARASGTSIEAFGADFTKIDEVRSLAERALRFLGGIDVLVNNAGITLNIPSTKSRSSSSTRCTESTSGRCSFSRKRAPLPWPPRAAAS